MMFVEVINFPNLTLISPFIRNPSKQGRVNRSMIMSQDTGSYLITFFCAISYYMVASRIWG